MTPLVPKNYSIPFSFFLFSLFLFFFLFSLSLTAQIISIINDDLQFTKFLLQKKANPNLRGQLGNTALHHAFQQQNQNLILLLTDSGGDLNVLNDANLTPLAYGEMELLKSLNITQGVCEVAKGKNSLGAIGQREFNNNRLIN